MKKKLVVYSVLLMGALLITAVSCSTTSPDIVNEGDPSLSAADQVTDSQPETQTDAKQETVKEGLADAFLEMEFTTSDGRTLQGTYFPASFSPAPLVIMMHWAPGDQSDMRELALWLQNRGFSDYQAENPSAKAWLNPDWFPQLEEGRSYGVFTFTFDGCEGGCKSFDREKWLLDAQAAVQTAYALEGVDPARIVTVGASIGADGAADGCIYLNSEYPGSCLGAFSMSPGDYLTLNYADVVEQLHASDPSAITYCLYAKEDSESAAVCQPLPESEAGKVFAYESNFHGLMLVQPNLEHDTLALMIEFLRVTVEGK